MKHASVLVCDSVPGANEIVPVKLPLVTSIVALTRSGGTGTTGVTSTPFLRTGRTAVSPAASVTLAVSDGGDGVVVDPLHAAAAAAIDPTMIKNPHRRAISSAF